MRVLVLCFAVSFQHPSERYKNSKISVLGYSLGSVMAYELLAERPFRPVRIVRERQPGSSKIAWPCCLIEQAVSGVREVVVPCSEVARGKKLKEGRSGLAVRIRVVEKKGVQSWECLSTILQFG